MNQNLIRLLNLRKRLREQIRTSGASGVPLVITELIHEIERTTDLLLYETHADGTAPPQRTG